MLEERVMLSDDSDRSTRDRHTRLAEHYRSHIRRIQTRDDSEKPRLADPRRPQQSDNLARNLIRAMDVFDLQVHVPEDLVISEGQTDVFDSENCRAVLVVSGGLAIFFQGGFPNTDRSCVSKYQSRSLDPGRR